MALISHPSEFSAEVKAQQLNERQWSKGHGFRSCRVLGFFLYKFPTTLCLSVRERKRWHVAHVNRTHVRRVAPWPFEGHTTNWATAPRQLCYLKKIFFTLEADLEVVSPMDDLPIFLRRRREDAAVRVADLLAFPDWSGGVSKYNRTPHWQKSRHKNNYNSD